MFHKIMKKLVNKKLNCQNSVLCRFYVRLADFLLNMRGCFIGSGAIIQDGATYPHGFNGILISGGAVIGKNAVIFHQVTIGSNTLKNSKGAGAPVIGDNCYIGAGAKIIGNVKIGNNVRIGANAVVVEDVPDDCVVVNQPSRVIQKDNIKNEFVSLSNYKVVKDKAVE